MIDMSTFKEYFNKYFFNIDLELDIGPRIWYNSGIERIGELR
jgi:hypothetical protein